MGPRLPLGGFAQECPTPQGLRVVASVTPFTLADSRGVGPEGRGEVASSCILWMFCEALEVRAGLSVDRQNCLNRSLPVVGHSVFFGSELDRYRHRLSYLYFKYHVVLRVTASLSTLIGACVVFFGNIEEAMNSAWEMRGEFSKEGR